jgi:hypothetical protein
LGYDVVKCEDHPSQDVIGAVESAANVLYTSTPPEGAFSTFLNGGIECDQFLAHGVDVSSPRLLTNIF